MSKVATLDNYISSLVIRFILIGSGLFFVFEHFWKLVTLRQKRIKYVGSQVILY